MTNFMENIMAVQNENNQMRETKMREWTTDEIIYIIYKHGMVIQLRAEWKFVDKYYTQELLEEIGITREELIESFEMVNQSILEEIERYYALGLTMADILEFEAIEYGMTVDELLAPLFLKDTIIH